MGAVTPVKAIPYPVTTDFADPRALRDLAAFEDTAFAAYDASFKAGPRPPSFLIRSTADGIAIGGGSNAGFGASTFDWNNTGGTLVGNATYSQDKSEVAGLWLIGAFLIIVEASGTPTADTALQATFLITTADPVTLVSGQLSATATPSVETAESNTAGEFLVVNDVVTLYRASILPLFGNFDTGAQTKKVGTGSAWWGIRLGDA